jgi:hypothetical protein
MKEPKYTSNTTLRDARNIARYGTTAKKSLARAALLLWPCERELKAAEAAWDSIIKDIENLRHLETFARKQLFRFTAGLDPTFIRDRARFLDKIKALLADYLVAFTAAVKRRGLALNLHGLAKAGYEREYANADRKTRHGLHELRCRLNRARLMTSGLSGLLN